MKPLKLSNEAEVRAAIHQGKEATVALISSLIRIIAIEAARIQALEDQLAKNRSNSGSRF